MSGPRPTRYALLVAAAYAAIGLIWILVSDRLAEALATSPAMLTTLQTYKGFLYVGVTAALAWVVVKGGLVRQERANQAMRAQEARFRTYHEQAPFAVFIIDATGRCHDANQRAADLVGCTPEALRALSLSDVVPPGRERLADEAFGTLALRGHLEGEHQLLRRDGGLVWVDLRSTRLDAGHFIVFAHDITERIAAQEQLRQVSAAFMSAGEGVVIADPEAVIVSVNPAFTRVTGYTQADVVGRTPNILQSGRHSRAFYEEMWRSVRQTGHWQGDIWNRRQNGEIYPEWLTITAVHDEAGNLCNYVGVFTDLSRLRNTESQVEYLTRHDPATDLPNRLQFVAHLDRALDRAAFGRTGFALMAIHLSRLKPINDSFGYMAGQAALKDLVTRIHPLLGPPDVLARTSADELGLLLESVGTHEQAVRFAAAVSATAETPHQISADSRVTLGTSLGVSFYPGDGSTAEQLLQAASAASTDTSGGPPGGLRFHDTALAATIEKRLTVTADLHGAWERNELQLHYQPIYSLRRHRVESVEALIRRRRPDGSLAMPGEFIAIAEETGQILQIGDWVIRTACRQLREWRDAGTDLDRVGVNVSLRQLADDLFPARIERIVREAGLEPPDLDLEVTESMVMAGDGRSEAAVGHLAGLGFHVSIDDFGTGSSSLQRLRRLPIATLKIDRAFLRHVPDDPDASEFLCSIVSLGSRLHVQTVVEGVETGPQLEFLARCGCDAVQGFHIGSPVPPGQITRRCRSTASRTGETPVADHSIRRNVEVVPGGCGPGVPSPSVTD